MMNYVISWKKKDFCQLKLLVITDATHQNGYLNYYEFELSLFSTGNSISNLQTVNSIEIYIYLLIVFIINVYVVPEILNFICLSSNYCMCTQ